MNFLLLQTNLISIGNERQSRFEVLFAEDTAIYRDVRSRGMIKEPGRTEYLAKWRFILKFPPY
ncbi:hypothetical protein EFB08_05775 [Rufibacter latericius]|uniref:Uncharacterized protein n=1 Tax=Rufibacter latericius TaxID=2487040 RepID=A0A3M9MTU1_9BACT|nr:hypothetical protein EFB08_05775 [Rufibacter latericius]